MAHFALLWKARTIENYRLNYEKEKLNSIKIMNSSAQRKTKTLYQRFCHYNSNTKKRISKTFLRYYPEGSAVYNFFYYLKIDQTFPNFLMKSVIGFVGGIILTYLCFMFFVFQLSISLIHATIMSSIIGVLLTLGLAFSYRIRCLVFLLIPQFFSRVGRYTLTCYALVLILTGPATNTLKNSEVLSESLACAEEQVKTNMYQINESVKKPYNSIKDSIGLMVGGVKQLAAKIKQTTMNLHRLTLSIAHSLQSSFTWLNTVADSCNRNLGSPYDRCSQIIQDSIIECQAAMGLWYSWLCDAGKLTEVACWPVKPLPAFCHVFDFANGNILGVVTKRLNTFTERINSMLYLEVHVHHSYSFRSNSSHSVNQVAAGIVTEIRNKADLMLTWLSWSSCVTSLSLLLIIFRAKYYQHMYETRSRFDNRYVTKELIDLDLKRLRQGKETVLPLNKREEGKYIKTSSFRLVSSERVHLSRSAVTMVITTFKLLIHMVADYSLYWVLMTIRHHGLYQTPLKPGSPNAGAYVSGSKLISKILMSLIGSITLPLATPPPSTITCLPNPYPPDFQRYLQIGILIFLLWFFALFEPYGLRLRHIIMGLYRPERAKARAVWLFNHIQRTRGSFLKFARRKLHREFKYSTEREHTFRRWLQDHVQCALLRHCLGIYPDDSHCVLCGVIEGCNESDGTLVWCNTPGCPGIFCTKCYSDIGELCTICLSPADYGDISDISLAKGSSDDSDDEDPKCTSQCKKSAPHKEDDNDDPSQNQSKHKIRWSLFRKEDPKKPEEYPLLERKKEENVAPRTNETKLSNAMMVRYNKYTDFDLQNERQKIIKSLGEDTACLICHNHCEVCAMNKLVNCKTNTRKVQKVVEHASSNGKTIEINRCYETWNSNLDNYNKKHNIIKNNEKDSRKSKHNLSIDESIAKFKQRFKQMRKYELNRRHSHPIIRSKNSRIFVLKIPSSLRFRRTSRKRKRRLKTLSKSTSLVFNPVVISSSQRFYINPNRARQCKSKLLIRTSVFGHRIINILHNIRCISSTAVEFGENTDQNSDINFDFNKTVCGDLTNTNLAMDYSKEIYAAIPGPSNFQTNNNVVQKKEPIKTKDNKEDTNAPKFDNNRKSDHKAGKLYNFCGSLWKIGRIFAPPVNLVNYFREDRVPVLYNTTNHKKRKKVESLEEINLRTSKKDNEATRKYRISTYLSEQDWMKKRCKVSKPKIAEDVNDDILKEILDTETKETKSSCRQNIIVNKKDAVGGKGDSKNTKLHSPAIQKKKDKNGAPVLQTKDPTSPLEVKKKLIKRNETHIPEKHDKKAKKHATEEFKTRNNKEHKATHHRKIRIHVKEADEKKIQLNSKLNHGKTFENVIKDTNKSNYQKKEEVLVITPAEDLKNQMVDVASSVEIIATGVPSQSMDFGGMSMSRSLEYYRSLGNRDFDPYVDFQDQVPIDSVMTKEVKEIQAVVRVSVEDAKAQTSDELACKKSTETNTAYRMSFLKKSAGKTITAGTSVNKPDVNTPKPQTKKTPKELREKKSVNNVHKSKSEKSNNPFSMIVRWCHVHLERKKRMETSTDLNIPSINDAEVAVFPVVQNNYCQYGETVPLHDQTTQVYLLKEMAQSMSHHSEMFREVGIDAITRMRNDATQYTYNCRNATTYFQGKRTKQRKPHKDASTIHFNALKCDVERDTMTAHNTTQSTAVQCYIPLKFNEVNIRELVQDFNMADIRIKDVPLFETLQKSKLKNIPEDRDTQENVQKVQEKEDNGTDFKILEPRPENKTKYLKESNLKTNVNEILQELKSVPEPVRFDEHQTEQNKSDKPNCPYCGARTSSGTTSSLGVFQSLPSMECTKYKNYDLKSDSEESKTGSDGDEDTKTTDTTVYTVSNLDYEPSPRRRRRTKLKLSVITKSNMATATETTKVCDVSTVTSDWWSPILERKNKRFTLEKKEVQVEIPAPKKKILKDRGVGTEGRIVTFSSAAQIIPSMHTHLDLMSPSRYLLESQKYYNELFAIDCPVSSDFNERYSADKRCSSNRRHVLKRKGYRAKRSEESYTSQKMLSPFMEQVWTAEAVNQRNPSLTVYHRKNRAPGMKNGEVSLPKGLQTKGVKKSKHPTRHGARKPELMIKRGEVNLLTRRYMSNDNITLDSHYTSFSENGSF